MDKPTENKPENKTDKIAPAEVNFVGLELVATPIGDPGDITLRAIEALRSASIVIGEERREVSTLLKRLGIEGKRMELLNEHSRDDDVRELADFCSRERVALVTDCGTPGFCDPGARLVALCRSRGIAIRSLPGASSLMVLLSMAGRDLREFIFRGFLPAEKEERARAVNELDREKRAIVLMDTPYRLNRLLSELAAKWPKRRALLGLDFTLPTENVWEDELSVLASRVKDRKAEFMLVVYPNAAPAGRPGEKK